MALQVFNDNPDTLCVWTTKLNANFGDSFVSFGVPSNATFQAVQEDTDPINFVFPYFVDREISQLVITHPFGGDYLQAQIAGGTIQLNAQPVAVALQVVNIAPGDPVNPRIDALVVSGAGIITVIQGVAAPVPTPPIIGGALFLLGYFEVATLANNAGGVNYIDVKSNYFLPKQNVANGEMLAWNGYYWKPSPAGGLPVITTNWAILHNDGINWVEATNSRFTNEGLTYFGSSLNPDYPIGITSRLVYLTNLNTMLIGSVGAPFWDTPSALNSLIVGNDIIAAGTNSIIGGNNIVNQLAVSNSIIFGNTFDLLGATISNTQLTGLTHNLAGLVTNSILGGQGISQDLFSSFTNCLIASNAGNNFAGSTITGTLILTDNLSHTGTTLTSVIIGSSHTMSSVNANLLLVGSSMAALGSTNTLAFGQNITLTDSTTANFAQGNGIMVGNGFITPTNKNFISYNRNLNDLEVLGIGHTVITNDAGIVTPMTIQGFAHTVLGGQRNRFSTNTKNNFGVINCDDLDFTVGAAAINYACAINLKSSQVAPAFFELDNCLYTNRFKTNSFHVHKAVYNPANNYVLNTGAVEDDTVTITVFANNVFLPILSVIGQRHTFFADGAASFNIFPSGADTINGVAGVYLFTPDGIRNGIQLQKVNGLNWITF